MTAHDYSVIYLHGFLSSPQSRKAQQTVDYCHSIGIGDRIHVPELTDSPLQNVRELQRHIDSASKTHPVVLMGSSLGGYYATYLAEQNNLAAVLINPAVRPFEYWTAYLGEHQNFYSGKTHKVTKEYIDELHSLECDKLSNPENFLLLVQAGDEVLDYRRALDKFTLANTFLQHGGDHSFVNYAAVLPLAFDFFAIKN